MQHPSFKPCQPLLSPCTEQGGDVGGRGGGRPPTRTLSNAAKPVFMMGVVLLVGSGGPSTWARAGGGAVPAMGSSLSCFPLVHPGWVSLVSSGCVSCISSLMPSSTPQLLVACSRTASRDTSCSAAPSLLLQLFLSILPRGADHPQPLAEHGEAFP